MFSKIGVAISVYSKVISYLKVPNEPRFIPCGGRRCQNIVQEEARALLEKREVRVLCSGGLVVLREQCVAAYPTRKVLLVVK